MRSASNCAWVLLLSACTQPPAEDDTADPTSESGSETGEAQREWQPVFQADEDIGAIMSVWGSSPDDVFVVGGQPEPGGGRVLHSVDEEWVVESLPAEVSMLNWVYGVDQQVWSVGLDGVIVRREGGVWTPEDSPTDRVLWGVWGASAEELWAVGGDAVSDDPVLLRRDGASGEWALVEVPELGVNSHGLFKIWGAAADDVWVVGDAGASLHYDGATWAPYPESAGFDIISVWGSDAEGVISVGGRASGRINRLMDLDGPIWAGETLAIPGLNGVWVDPEQGATAVGVQGTIIRISANGFDVQAEDSGTNLVLHSVFGFAGGPRFAVGGSLLMPPPFVGVILRAD
ncbi:hypothetical protein DB30_06927 [Enhygromyxa salina]|uniref:Uncharacterized protein n=1 Tax=Enhygromyxa salina TaxID=215803 RepID=A0A0C2CXH0_9BACT|nr:hypothetical protein [Enhygromyxa salina]KIG14325.1 hypothetical protein DB30_06927 [Enhygromyxa salina]